LLVEDEPADADLVEGLLQGSDIPFEVLRAETRAEAVRTLVERDVDIILLDLNLPDDQGLSSLHAVRQAAAETPTVVLTGSEDEELALSCIDAGAQDYLFKGELREASLRRSLSYAMTRMREAQIRELRDTLEKLGGLTSTSTVTTGLTVAGAAPLQTREPALFENLADQYRSLLYNYLEHGSFSVSKPLDLMESIVTSLGDASAGPRDLIDLHVAALNRAVAGEAEARARGLATEGRLTALEMMGLLVDYYRTGPRRRAEA
jgi:CheY-like chemotaxis protein